MVEMIGSFTVLVGSVFLFSAGLGVLRMPDAFNRIQTGTKASTLGTILVLLGLAILHPAWTWKLLILIFFVLLTNPVSSHALARAAHATHLEEMGPMVIDRLKEGEAGESDAAAREQN